LCQSYHNDAELGSPVLDSFFRILDSFYISTVNINVNGTATTRSEMTYYCVPSSYLNICLLNSKSFLFSLFPFSKIISRLSFLIDCNFTLYVFQNLVYPSLVLCRIFFSFFTFSFSYNVFFIFGLSLRLYVFEHYITDIFFKYG